MMANAPCWASGKRSRSCRTCHAPRRNASVARGLPAHIRPPPADSAPDRLLSALSGHRDRGRGGGAAAGKARPPRHRHPDWPAAFRCAPEPPAVHRQAAGGRESRLHRRAWPAASRRPGARPSAAQSARALEAMVQRRRPGLAGTGPQHLFTDLGMLLEAAAGGMGSACRSAA